jgi:hypothetical protein
LKVLLFTDLPPCDNFTGGIVLRQMAELMPSESIVCFAACNPYLEIQRPDEMRWMPTQLVDKPNELSRRYAVPAPPFPQLLDVVEGVWDRNVTARQILKKAVAFGRAHRVDAVLAVLQGQMIINLALPLARALDVPLYTMVFDPLIWWKRHNAPDALTAWAAQSSFDKSVAASRAVATASWAMTDAYEHEYGVSSRPVIRSHNDRLARRPDPALNTGGELIIGMAGQVYAADETYRLVKALNSCGWNIRGREVRLRFFGKAFPDWGVFPKGRLQAMGWLGEGQLVEALSHCDMTYCPYPFHEGMEQVSRLSFPSKLPTYLAAGRPSVFHGPGYASPAAYFREKGIGPVADGLQPSSVYNAIDQLARDPAYYRRCALGAQSAFEADFTLETMRRNLYAVLGLPDQPAPAGHEGDYPVIDERKWEGAPANRWLKKKPSLIWRALQSLGAGRSALAYSFKALSSPLRRRIDLVKSWRYQRTPGQPPADGSYACFSTGQAPWDYVACLEIGATPRASRYLRLSITSMGEDVFAQLIDKDVNPVGERLRIPANRWWFNAWFDLDQTPTAEFVMIQAGEAPKGAEVRVHRALMFTPWPSLLRSLRLS